VRRKVHHDAPSSGQDSVGFPPPRCGRSCGLRTLRDTGGVAGEYEWFRQAMLSGGAPLPDAAESLRLAVLAGPAGAAVFLYGEIGEWDITAESFLASLPASGDVTVRVNSPGGNAFDALAMHSALSSRRGRVRVRVDGLCASAATIVAMAADRGDL